MTDQNVGKGALWLRVQKAARCEENDEHLSTVARESIVAQFRQEYPEEPLPSDLDDAYVQVLALMGGW